MSDDFDELFGDFDPTADLDELDWNNPDGPQPLKSSSAKDKDGKDGKGAKKDSMAGVDDEVKIAKRKLRAKLDADRLLGPNGLEKIRKDAPKKLKFKGKGHEYKDCAKLLAFYQLWAHDLFPKAKFRDTLSMIEKLGHNRRIQVARTYYIDEDKRAKAKAEEEEMEKNTERIGDQEASTAPPAKTSTATNDVPDEMDMEDIFGAPPAAARSSPPEEGDIFDDFDDAAFDAEFAAAFAERDEEKAKEREAIRQKNLADMEARRKEKEKATEQQPSASNTGYKSTLDPDFDEDELFAEPARRPVDTVMSGALPSATSKKDASPPKKAAEEEFPDLDEMDYEPNEDELEALYAMP
ncbi:Swi3-domain-containing protein [Ascobolus immersus RN42]|uniref:Chromosome segregation in meiosis protein n=1 Tax=Ascobolus immersus RN42 TaxID=1160509 RepID=A0A3N4IM10_ASCIM|nr:Swi3-domain-containing protein [Ascobolus immersus RN42]